jgi:hypothetical protein
VTPRSRQVIAGAFALVATATAGASAAIGSRGESAGYPGVRLTVVGRVPVFATFLGRQTVARVCPREPVPLGPVAIRQAGIAVAKAMPPLYARATRPGAPRIDARGAVATAGRATTAHAGTAFRTFCGETVWRRSVFVAVRLPHVRFSSSLAHPSFLVARSRLGWIIWAQVH